MLHRALLASLVLSTSCAPAIHEQPPPPPPSKPIAPPPAKPEVSHARWRFAEPNTATAAELDLGEKGTLQVGARGRRWRIAKDGTVEMSAVLLAQHLIDARREGSKYLFLGADGSTYLSDDPLSAPTVTRPSPDDRGRYVMGKSALLGIAEGTLLRSTDGGASWSKSKAPVGPDDAVAGLVANGRGEAMLLLHPQRVLLSVDDGSTWTPLPTPGIGAHALLRDGAGDLWLEGALVEKMAKLSGSPLRLEVATGVVDLKKANLKEKKAKAPLSARTELVGDRLVTVVEEVIATSKKKRIEVVVHALDKEPGEPFVVEQAASPVTRVDVAGFANQVVLSVFDPEAEPRAMKFFRTTDDGKNWEPLGDLEGNRRSGFALLAGPGWIGVSDLCPATGACDPPRMLIGKKWQPMGIDKNAHAAMATFDLARDRVFVIAWESAGTAIYAGKKEGPLKRIDVGIGSFVPLSATVDREGTLRLASDKALVRIGADLKQKPSLFHPFMVSHIALASERAFASHGDSAWESNDGGEHWTKVAAGGSGDVACGASGCVQGNAIRVGWDLPDPGKPLIAALPTPKGAPTENKTPAAPAPVPIAVKCKVSGPAKTYQGHDQTFAFDNDVRMIATVGELQAPHSIQVIRGAEPPKTIKLLGKAPPPKTGTDARHWETTSADGIVLARYSYSTVATFDVDGNKKYNPVDVELGWYSARTGKSHSAKLPKVKPFRVGRTGPSALTSIVEGGVLFLPNRGEAPLYFVRENGQVETIPRPAGADPYGFTSGTKLGDRIVLTQGRGEDIALIVSNDLGKTWSTTVWSLGSDSMLEVVQGKPSLVLGLTPFGGEPAGVIALDAIAAIANDPPPTTRPLKKPMQPSCGSKGGVRYTVFEDVPMSFHVDLDKTSVEAPLATAFSRLSAEGGGCVEIATAVLPVGEDVVLMMPTADPAHSWLIAPKYDPMKGELRPMSCAL